MGDMLNTAISGLLTYQRALSTTSHNIANVNTEGYSRQNVDIQTRNPSLVGGNFVGSGVQIESIGRSYDQFISTSLRESQSAFSRLDKFTELAGEIDNILADPVGGVSPILQEFFASVQDVSDDPASSTARSHMINTANSLVSRFDTFNTRLEQLNKNSASDVRTVVDDINSIVDAIKNVNVSLEQLNTTGELNQQAADLLDQRDQLLNELSSRVGIQVINEQSNNMTIMVGNGQTILNGATSFKLATQPNVSDPTQDIIVYQGFSSVNDISGNLNGGELGGLLEYRSTILDPTRKALGRMAIGLADSFNDQHREGMDLQGNLGGDFFNFTQPNDIAFTSNTGNSTITTTISNVSDLTLDDYTLNYNGTRWQLTSDSGTVSPTVPFTTGTASTLTFEGLTIQFDASSTPAAGDQFTIRPTIEGAQSINVAISNPSLIAAASPVRTGTPLSNLGDGKISSGIVTDVTNANLLTPVNFTFNSATSFFSDSITVVGGVTIPAGNPIAYSNNLVVDSNGWQVTLTGIPAAGDTMSIQSNNGGTGDNRNALLMGGLQTTGLFDNGTSNYQEDYSVLVGRVGSVTHSAQVDREAQETFLIQANDRRSENSGVNLDEEAADLIKFQQAYEATARIISTAQTIFDTLLNSVR